MPNKAEVGRFDGTYHIVAFNEGDKIESLLTKAGLTISDGESINDDSGEVVNRTDTAVDSETYHIVGNFKQGNDMEELSTFDNSNLADAIGDVDEERANIQKEKAKAILREILGRKDVCEFNLAVAQKELKSIEKELKLFKRR